MATETTHLLLVFLFIAPSYSLDSLPQKFSWYHRIKSKIQEYSRVNLSVQSQTKACPVNCICLFENGLNVRCLFLRLQKVPTLVGNGTITL